MSPQGKKTGFALTDSLTTSATVTKITSVYGCVCIYLKIFGFVIIETNYIHSLSKNVLMKAKRGFQNVLFQSIGVKIRVPYRSCL